MSLLVCFSADFTSAVPQLGADDTDWFDPELAVELLLSQLWDLGSTGIFRDGNDRFVAGFDDEATARAAVAHLRKMPGPIDDSISIEAAPTVDQWQPDTEATDLTIDAGTSDGGPIQLAIRAGGAFGHGGHPTTELALALICSEIERRIQTGRSTRMLDVGTGTGVLALAAAASGAQSATGIDNDPVAVEMAAENLARNHERGFVPRDTEITFDGRTLAQVVGPGVAGSFDVVAINVLLPVHRDLAEQVLASLAAGATLITAGYLADQQDELLDLYPGLEVVERPTIGDWIAHRLHRL